MELTENQGLLIASLAEHGGFKCLLDILREDLKNLETQIEDCETEQGERRLVAEWRARRRLIDRFENITTYYRQLLEDSGAEIAPQMQVMGDQLSPTAWQLEQFGKLITGEEVNG